MFHHILVPLDGSSLAECVLPHISALAQGSHPQISLLRVLNAAGDATRPRPVDPFDWQIRRAEAETYLKDIAQRLEKAGLAATTYVVEGKAAQAVIEFANQQDVDLLVMSSHGQSGMSGWNVSSVVQKVILRVQRSVMIVRAYAAPAESQPTVQYRRILLPLDGSQRAESALANVSGLAQAHEALVLVAHVIQKPEMPRRTPPSQEDLQLSEQVVERNRREVTQYLADLKNRLDVNLDVRVLVSGQVVTALQEVADKENIDLVVMSAHGYSGQSKWPYGSVVIDFIVYGTEPLLVIQDLPPGSIQPSPAELAAKEHGGR